MQLKRYELKAGRNLSTFEFISEGKRGEIRKLIQFEPMNYPGLYNLAFGDYGPEDNIDDQIITDNGDSEKVPATVVAAIYAFADKHRDAWIYATGSNAARTRLYQMGINKYFEIVDEDFDIMGERESEWEWYEKGVSYQAFAIHCKNR